MQQTDAKVIYSPNKTKIFAQKINEKTNKNKHATINDVAHEAFASLLPVTKDWYGTDFDIEKYFTKHSEHYYQFSMPGIAAFVPTKNRYAHTNAKVYVGWKYKFDGTESTTPPNNTPNKTYGDAPLFEYSDYSHTERQLAICALYNANNSATNITEDSPICLSNEDKTPNIYPYGLSANAQKNNRKQSAKQLKTQAQQLTDRMYNTKGILYIYTRALPCTSGQNFDENGGMLCVDYYAHLLKACPEINIHVYCNKNEVDSLLPHLLDKVDCRLICNKMINLFKKITDEADDLLPSLQNYTSTIKHIMNHKITPSNNGWQFTKMKPYAGGPAKINKHIIASIIQYVKESDDLATSGEILTALIRLLLNQSGSAAPKETYDTTFDRLIMHLIDPLL